MKENVGWNEHYKLGVEEIDKEHKKLFAIMDKILELVQNGGGEKSQHACGEGIKFLENYARIHFEHEEKFMQSLNYDGYERHKKIHDDLRNNILPIMKEELEANDYNEEIIKHFLGICNSWLITHIKVEDQAILNRKSHSQMKMEIDSMEIMAEEALISTIREIFDVEAKPISHHYNGWDFGKAIFHELIFVSENHNVTQVLFTIEQKAIFAVAQKRLGESSNKVDSFLMSRVREILHTLGNQISLIMGYEGEYKSRSGVVSSTGEIEEIFRNKSILYSTLFRTELGNFACSVYQR